MSNKIVFKYYLAVGKGLPMESVQYYSGAGVISIVSNPVPDTVLSIG